METILFLAHTDKTNGLPKAAFETLAAAKSLADFMPGSTLVAGLVGAAVDAAAGSIAGAGASRILGVAGEAFSQARYASDAAAMEAICRAAAATIVVAPATSRFSRVIAGVAHRLSGRADTHVAGVSVADGKPVISRWYYRQRMVATLGRVQRPWFIALDPGSVAPWAGVAGSASVEMLEVAVPQSRTRVVGEQAPAASQQTIRPDADVLFVAGAGWCKKQRDGQLHVSTAADLILGFLNKAAASLGSSKSLVDQAGEGNAVLPFMTHLNQVGQTGSTPRHPKGLATCCHGEEPHVVGWRFVNERRAINLDPNCGWAHGKADVLYVADAFEVMTKVNELV